MTPAELAARGLKVRELEWQDQAGGSYCWIDGLHYYTEGSDEDQDWYWSCMVGNDDIFAGENQTTRDKCKAAAQADYTARILAALEAPEALAASPTVQALLAEARRAGMLQAAEIVEEATADWFDPARRYQSDRIRNAIRAAAEAIGKETL